MDNMLLTVYVISLVCLFSCSMVLAIRSIVKDKNASKLTLLDRLSLIEEQVLVVINSQIIFYSVKDSSSRHH